MKCSILFLAVMILVTLFSCTRTPENPEIVFDIILEQDIPGTDSTNYFFPIKHISPEKSDTANFSIFFEDISLGKIFECEISKQKINVSPVSESDPTVWNVNVMHKTPNSFCFLNNESNILKLKDYSGTLLRIYQLEPKNAVIDLLSGFESNEGFSILMGNASKSIGMTSREERIKYYHKVKPIAMIHVSTEDIEYKEIGIWPEIYRNTGNDYNDAYARACFGKNHNACISFGADHNLYFYNDTILKYSKPIRSNYISKFTPYPDDKTFDMVYLREYIQNEPKYIEVIYDPWANKYYRIVKHRFEKASSDSKPDYHWSVIVTDDEINAIGECIISSEYYMGFFVPTPFGVALMKWNDSGSKGKTLTLIKLSTHE